MRTTLAICLLILGAISLGAGCLFGPTSIPWDQALKALLEPLGLGPGPDKETVGVVVLSIRLSRACLAWLCGAGLAVSGAVFQAILQNPLADPFTIGVSTGAAFGASLAIFFGLAGLGAIAGPGLLPLAAMAGACLALMAVLALSRSAGGLKRETVVLAGIVVATFLSALVALIKSLDEESVSGIVFWIMGSFQGRGWEHAAFLLPYALPAFLVIGIYSRELDLLSMGDTQARLLGLDAEQARRILLLAASLLAGATVAVAGVIGFVGLVAPHLVRLLLGAEHRPLLLFSALLGGLALLWSDVLARSLLPGGEELPVGVVTALMGGPFFCLLLRRKASGA